MSVIRENRLFLGNPGAGKSTLINCLIGENHMQSGVSWGGGLTKDYQRFIKDGIAYMDTPGLADETIQPEAADAITKALKQSGTYKLFFLVRLQNGRVVSDDLVTLERVLDSIDAGDLNYKFTIVMNCVGQRQYESLAKRGEEFKRIKTLINRRYLTESFCFIPSIKALEERSDTVVELPAEVRTFMEVEAPVIRVEEVQVKLWCGTGLTLGPCRWPIRPAATPTTTSTTARPAQRSAGLADLTNYQSATTPTPNQLRPCTRCDRASSAGGMPLPASTTPQHP